MRNFLRIPVVYGGEDVNSKYQLGYSDTKIPYRTTPHIARPSIHAANHGQSM